jgi:hypothetical protein
MAIWRMDGNWNYSSFQTVGAINSPAAIAQESLFSQDFNGDSLIGYLAIEGVGNTKLLRNTQNQQLFAHTGNNTPINIKSGNIPVTNIAGWQTLAAETINGQNQVMWRNISANSLAIWRMDADWNYSSFQTVGAINSPAAIAQEPLFSQDFNGNGVIGL